jgi:acyl-CoA thioesterase
MHPFDLATALEPVAEGTFRVRTCAAYANQIGPFGGVTAALMMRSVLQHPARSGVPVTLTVNYAAAIADGEYLLQTRAVRTGRSTQHWLVEALQEGEVVGTATAVTASRRETWCGTCVLPPAGLPPPEAIDRLDGPGAPVWFANYDMRSIYGGYPAVENYPGQPLDEREEDSRSAAWIRDRPGRPLDFCSLTALCDAFYPRVFVKRRAIMPASTISMTIYFHADEAMLAAQGESFLLGVAEGVHYRHGFFDQRASLWGTGATLLATTHQIMFFRG